MPSPKSRSPWKVLILALLACTVCFLLAVAGITYWFVSQHRNTARHLPDDEREHEQAEVMPDVAEPPKERPQRSAPPREATPAQNAILASKASAKPQAGDDIFRDVVVPELEIDFSTEARLRLTVSSRTYVKVNIREGDRWYTNVAIRLKGGPGSYQQLHDTPSFTVNFDKFAPDQTFHGLKKIHLNSSVQDRTCLNEKISRELFEAAGVPVPRAGHAIVTFNGRDPRLYVVLEGVNKQFLKRYFDDAKGDVYDGHSGTDVTDKLPLNSGDDDRRCLKALAQAVRESNLSTRLAKLEKTLDIDRFLSFMALELMLSHWDGYTTGRNNYRIFHDRATDRMVFIPHGMDQVLGNPRQPFLSPGANGLVARAVLQIPELRERYRDRVIELSTNVFRAPEITSRIREVAGRVGEALADIDPQGAKSYRDRIGPAVSRKVQQRVAFLQREVNPTARPNPAKLDQHSILTLTNWTSRIDLGDAQFKPEIEGNDNGAFLYIRTTNSCTASWRTTTFLEQGKYRFEARIKTKGVVFSPDPRDGAGLRTSRFRVGQKNSGDRDWFTVTFDFDVQEDEADKELICELRALKGEIWYDLKSLKLKPL